MRPVIFLDIDDVLAISREYTSYQVMTAFRLGDLNGWPELWQGLVFPEARTNLVALHDEFWPQYVISSSWSNYLSEGQMREVFKRSGLAFVADNMHRRWTTPKAQGPSRTKEIQSWIAAHGQPDQPLLVIDDLDSGQGLLESLPDQQNLVVLCEPWIGFVAAKLAEAQIKLRAQLS